jgi:hypothetical protein
MEERTIDNDVPFPSNHQASAIAEPREGAFNLVSTLVSPHLASIIVLSLFVVTPVGADQFNAPPGQPFSQGIAVVPLVCDQPLRVFPGTASTLPRNRDLVQRPFDERDFRRGRTVQVVSQRNTLAVDHHHPLCALPPLGFADTEAPFLAGAKLPSTKASDQSNWPLASNSARKALHASSQMSCSSHCRNLRQQVEGLGYRLGRSAQGAPVRGPQRIPSNTAQLSMNGLPPFRETLGCGSRGSIFAHWLSVSLQRSFFVATEKTPFYDRIYVSSAMAQV